MTLFDTLDGLFMNTAYGWAFARPVRKVFYNLTITGVSIAVALAIGGIEIGGLLSTELHLHGRIANALANFNLNLVGFVIVGVFITVWVVAITVWHFGRFEQRWSTAEVAAVD
jgi:High-affinity nickel permease